MRAGFDTDGFPIVIANERGPIDNNATVKFPNLNVKLDYSPTDRLQAFARAGRFSEERDNGKILEVNDTEWTSVSGGVRGQLPDTSSLQATVFGDIENFHSNFLAVTQPSATAAAQHRASRTDQNVPTRAAGATLQWSRALGGRTS